MSALENQRHEALSGNEIQHVAEVAQESGEFPLRLIAVEALVKEVWPGAQECEFKQSDTFRWQGIYGEDSAWAVIARFADGRTPETVKALTLEDLEAALRSRLAQGQPGDDRGSTTKTR